MTRDVQ